jgi:hypothetical protein
MGQVRAAAELLMRQWIQRPKSRVFAKAVDTVLAIVFLFAALSKLSDLAAFRLVLHSYSFLPPWFALLLLGLVPAIELTLGAALLQSHVDKSAIYATVGLLALFLGVAIIDWVWFKKTGGCGCVKVAPTSYIWQHGFPSVIRNGLFLASAVYSWRCHRKDN